MKSKFAKIPKGYRLTVESCENDGDFSDTTVIEGLSKEDVKQFVLLCKLMETEDYGNLYYPEEKEKVALFNAINAIFNLVKDCTVTLENIEEYEDDFWEILYKSGFTGKAESQYTRYCNGYKVEYIPEDIFIEDVTGEFK